MKNKLNENDYFYQKILNATYEQQKKVFSPRPEQVEKINLRADKSMTPALFKPDPLMPDSWLAHPSTIKAVRKEIFLGGNDLSECEISYECQSCHHTLDVQFWNFCPFCEKEFPKDIEVKQKEKIILR